ncbi:predicted protein [Chaetoceros tenuissimus]|uniref:HMG box domain-containing protein n=1 Tax=Chaetoceros tenuissimus TaxID=426638 RepID=A0AAD3CN11_9STRA|nr:predicted protein [Chaetoceros tenuissimus]
MSNNNITHALDAATNLEDQINYLRKEANNLEATARRLRDIANILEIRKNDLDQAIEGPKHEASINASLEDGAPLDEHGKPKYNGKKRGRKPTKKRKRSKRGQTAYTLFVKDAYPKVKDEFTSRPDVNKEGVQSKDVINIIAQRWKETSAEEKLEWKHRAQAMADMETNEEEAIEPIEGDMNGDNIIHENVRQENILLGESLPQNVMNLQNAMNLHVPVAPALEIGNGSQNMASVHNFAPIDIEVQLQMQMANVLDNANINESAGNERLQDIDIPGIQDPHVLGVIAHHDTLNIGGETGLDHSHHGFNIFGNNNETRLPNK